jgi:hypothetical protein
MRTLKTYFRGAPFYNVWNRSRALVREADLSGVSLEIDWKLIANCEFFVDSGAPICCCDHLLNADPRRTLALGAIVRILLSLSACFIYFVATPAQTIPEQFSEIRQNTALIHRHVN